jgi:sugar-specific transcriptional regulator TrmB
MSAIKKEHIDLLKALGLKEYPAKALAHLLELGESKAPELSSASGVPKARIYGVLSELADQGLVEIKPGRPTRYRPKPPAEIIQRVIQERTARVEEEIERIESLREDFESAFQPLYESSTKKARKPLLKTVSVGEPSEEETKLMYREAKSEINIVSKAMEWLPKVKKTLKKALERGVGVKVLLLSPKHLEKKSIFLQKKTLKLLKEDLPEVQVRFSNFILPLRGSIIDPSYDYSSGKAMFLVEEKGVPFPLRDAAVTENPSLVAGMKRYFDLIWYYESKELKEK